MKKKTSAGLGTVVLIVVILVVRVLSAPGEGGVDGAQSGPDRGTDRGSDRVETRTSAAERSGSVGEIGSSTSDDAAAEVDSDDALIERLFRERRSDEMVTAVGEVDRTLPDDNVGSRHQKFILELATGRTLLISHNIDLAPRVPLDRGDRVIVRGEYEWTERGGVVHWTHHDPKQWREGGWIEHEGQRYE